MEQILFLAVDAKCKIRTIVIGGKADRLQTSRW